jgi:putative endonuclease
MAWMYILECCDGSYCVGSTKDLELRFLQPQSGKGSRYTSGRLPVQLIYCEEYDRVSDAFYREKQVQGWTRRKREALINGTPELLPVLAKKIFDKSKIKDNSVVE